ncbi:MAG: DOMON domain-containing protein [Candidatus Bipolaricaulis sp.]|nr:DOMON domain-containing protein [Candidatus Bipolaricaulis sp.]
MLVITKEALIVIGIVLGMSVVALVLLFAGPRDDSVAAPATSAAATSLAPGPAVATAPAPASSGGSTGSVPPAAVPTTSAASQPVSTFVQVVEPTETQPLPAPAGGSPIVAIDGVIYADEYAHWTEAGGFQVHWSNDTSFLRMGVVSPGTGYVAVGFDPDDRMQGANFVLIAVRDGQVWTRDDYGYGALAHASDTSLGGTDDILAAAGREANGQTSVVFVIALNSGDPMDKPMAPGTTYDIVIAFHETSDEFDAYHSRRGAGKMRLDPG